MEKLKTRDGIYLDITKSEYKITTRGLTFYFSSVFYLESFARKLEQYDAKIEQYLLNRLHMPVDAKKCAAIMCYSEVEKRGFYVTQGDKVYRHESEFKAYVIIV